MERNRLPGVVVFLIVLFLSSHQPLLALPLPQVAPPETAVYQQVPLGKPMQDWMVLGPIPAAGGQDEEAQQKFFTGDAISAGGGETAMDPDRMPTVSVGPEQLAWRRTTATDGVVDLSAVCDNKNFATAYGWAEIVADRNTSCLLGLGSDDAVRVWVNGRLVHDHWIARPVREDDDLVPIKLRKGPNTILVKVHNLEGKWGFQCRFLDDKARATKLVQSAATGEREKLDLLLAHGTDINAVSRRGFTAWQAATMRGYKELAAYLASQGADTTRSMPSVEQYVQRMLAQEVSGESPGCAVLVARDGKVLFAQCHGYADIEQKIPVTADTEFRIGSVSKQFTAAAILKLCEKGKLDLEDKLSKFLPDFPRGDEVTIHQLLTHTSGIHSYTSKPEFYETVTQPVEPRELIESFQDDPFDFEPGAQWRYNNSGYFLLGYIVEQLSGMPYGEYLRQTFFEPLGMNHTGVHAKNLGLEHEARGYSDKNGAYELARDWDMSRAGGAGALYSTLGDLYLWNEAVFAGKVLSQKMLDKAFKPAVLADGSATNYGYGWMMIDHRGLLSIQHAGGLDGFQSHLVRYPAQNLTIIALSNALPAGSLPGPATVTPLIAELLLHEEMGQRTEMVADATVGPEALQAIVGRYDYGGPILVVTRKRDRVFAQLAGQPSFEIFPKSATEFFWKVVEANVEFVKDDQGRVTKAIHHQNGRTINAPRLEDVEDTKLPPEKLDEYVGQYDYGAAIGKLTVVRKGSHLWAQLPGQPSLELLPAGEDEFVWKLVQARIKFQRDDSGRITGGVHHQGGQQIDAPKIQE